MCPAVKPDEPLLALEFRDFEEQYHLPKGIDLEANPEVALQEAGSLAETTVAHNCLPLAIVGSHQEALPVETPVGGPQLPAVGNCGITSLEQKSVKKRRKHRRRGARVPLP